MAKEIVTGLQLDGDAEKIYVGLQALFEKDFEFFTSGDDKPFSDRLISAGSNLSPGMEEVFSSYDGKLEAWTNGVAENAYIKNGLVFPDNVGAVWFNADVPRDAMIEGNSVEVQIQPQGRVPGVYFMYVTATLEGGEKADMEHVVFLDGNKVAKALGVKTKEVERGEIGKDGEFILRESSSRNDAIVAREEVMEKEPEKPRKSVMEQNIEAGYPDRIKDLGTGLNRVYMKVFEGDFRKLNHAALFPRDSFLACPVLSDARVNLGDMTLIAFNVKPEGKGKSVEVSYAPAVFELNLAHYENEHSAYGPALTKDYNPAHAVDGTVYYMDVTGLGREALLKIEAAAENAVGAYNSEKNHKQKLQDIILKEAMDLGAKSPVLALGKEFDAVVREREAREAEMAREAEIQREKAKLELAERNAAIKADVKARKKAGQYIEPESRDIIFVHKPVIVKDEKGNSKLISILKEPDKEKGEDHYKIQFKAGFRDMEIRIPKASEELGQDGKPLSFVKKIKNPFSEVGYVINVSHKLGKQFPAYCNGQPVGNSIGYSELYSYIELKNHEFREIERERREDNSKQGILVNSEVMRGNPLKGKLGKSNRDSNGGYSDGM